ncbi:arginine--tRNA ligase [Patescibacteria group bacterium]|nr:arginine--tRNA ligase [Patescibacteria group bacterium]
MYVKQEAIQEVIKSLKKHIGKSFTVSADMLETPPDLKLGDVAFPVFELAKGEKRNPVELATELAVKIGPGEFIEKINSAGPYVNFVFKSDVLATRVIKEVEVSAGKYGHSTSGEGVSVLVDYAQPNTHKEFHVGHIRNAVLGQSIINVLRASGYEVVGASYPGDIGAHVAKVLWCLDKFHSKDNPPKEGKGKWLGEIYTEATKYIEQHPEAKEEVASIQRELESHEEPWQSLWKKTRAWSLDAFKDIFKQLHIKPDVWYFESEVEEAGKKLAKKLLTDGLAKKSEGAVVVDLEDVDLGIFLILKSDGSSLYATKELALILRKIEEYDPDRLIYVVDNRQSLYFSQVFKTAELMGIDLPMTHIAYDMVNLPEGTMSSRSGNIVTYEVLRDAMVERLKQETRSRHEDWSQKKVDSTAMEIALASITFMMLRQDANSIITFDLEEALSFDGFTAPYILYTIARIESMKKKTKIKARVDGKYLQGAKEALLVRKIAEFPEVIQRASKQFHISAVATWAFEASKLFAEYYHDVKVIDDENKEASAARLALCLALQQTLQNALKLLGIESVKEM